MAQVADQDQGPLLGLVWEIGVEELPARYLYRLLEALAEGARAALAEARLPHDELKALGTPRRLVLRGRVGERQTAQTVRTRGPRAVHAFRDGKPTPALEGFLRRTGAGLEAVREDADGYLVVEQAAPRRPAAEVLPEVLARVAEGLPLPRSMRWGAGDARFLRPVRWLLLVLGGQVLPMTAFGVTAGAVTYGNRTDHPGPLPVDSVEAYDRALAVGGVMLDPAARRRQIAQVARELAAAAGAAVVEDADLLDEVAALVEWPTPFLGHFDRRYLAVPEPVLMTSMKVHQRYFPLREADGQALYPGFIGVRNGVGRDLEAVRRGNQKVLRARLEDAWFFYQEDLKHPLEGWRPKLDGIVFHAKLGTVGDKVRRLEALVERLQDRLGLDPEQQRALVTAVGLCKCDLCTHVVGEFPELQGIMGGIYAQRQGYPTVVAQAVGEHYRPAFAGDAIPEGRVGQWLALLDRVDTLVGAQLAGIAVSGSEDPFGIRRAALGVGRILLEGDLPPTVALADLLRAAAAVHGGDPAAAEGAERLISQRLKGYLEEVQGWPSAWAAAVLEAPAPWQSGVARYQFFRGQDPAALAAVSEAFRRVDRLWDRQVPPRWEAAPAASRVEAALAAQLAAARPALAGGLEEWWQQARELVAPIHEFLTAVLVNDPDPDLRARRMGWVGAARAFLVQKLHWGFLG